MLLPDDLVRMADTGVIVIVGTRDADCVPEVSRAWGVRVLPECDALARHLEVSMIAVGFAGGAEPAAAPVSSSVLAAAEHAPGLATDGAGITVRYFPSDDSVFIDDAYLIKGVPGRIFHKLLQVDLEQHRQQFTNREIRLDPSLKLPEFQDNLEARLILLRRRL